MDSIDKLSSLFRKFPTVGSRTAGRFVYYLLKLPKEQIKELTDAILELSQNVKLCQFCFNPYQSSDTLCAICRNSSRNQQLLCIVEKEADLLSLEDSHKYQGRYFILGGTIGMLHKDATHLRLDALKKRVQENNFSEIIVALNPTSEGRATSTLVEAAVKEVQPAAKITHLARGLPVGGELEYADPETLESALEGRK